MSSYAMLLRGDRLPTVAVLQLLLNRAGNSLSVDGTFGRHTERALSEFQRSRRMLPTGVADGEAWERLFFHDRLPLVDFVDVFDENIYKNQAAQITDTGGQPVMMGGMSNGLAQLGQALLGARQLFLLRFTGHGCPGVQAIAMGMGGWIEQRGRHKIAHHYPHQTTSINKTNLEAVPQMLRGIFSSYGSVELHGCHVAGGPVGHKFVSDLANILGVPVTAGIGSQRSALHFKGATFTAVPGGNLSQWSKNLPPFTPITIP
jgi:peptidoglycan hydrolase-like protein with peptidoglycan-binding domain